jgi:3-phosphoshikimate 1-carboxyvinyltransferase
MAIAIAAIRADGPVTIKNASVVKKSYPNFFEDYQSLGGIIHES